jgi:hypothetical protein
MLRTFTPSGGNGELIKGHLLDAHQDQRHFQLVAELQELFRGQIGRPVGLNFLVHDTVQRTEGRGQLLRPSQALHGHRIAVLASLAKVIDNAFETVVPRMKQIQSMSRGNQPSQRGGLAASMARLIAVGHVNVDETQFRHKPAADGCNDNVPGRHAPQRPVHPSFQPGGPYKHCQTDDGRDQRKGVPHGMFGDNAPEQQAGPDPAMKLLQEALTTFIPELRKPTTKHEQ